MVSLAELLLFFFFFFVSRLDPPYQKAKKRLMFAKMRSLSVPNPCSQWTLYIPKRITLSPIMKYFNLGSLKLLQKHVWAF